MSAVQPDTEHQLYGLYQLFVRAVMTADVATARSCVAERGFVAQVPGHDPMDLNEFINHVATLRRFAPDYTERINVHDVHVQGDVIVVMYTAAFTVGAERVNHFATDVMAVEDGRVTAFRSMFNREQNQIQAFGTVVPTPGTPK